MSDQPVHIRSLASVLASSLGAMLAVAAVVGFVAGTDLMTAAAATLLHILATVLTARAIAAAGAGRSEIRLFAAAAAALPGIGAGAAWWFCVSSAPRHASNAHAENDPLLGNAAHQSTDLQRELSVNSYSQVVRHGSLEEKRNLLRRLAQLGTPRHVSIVRQFLFENEPELRLCAYAELARICQRHEQEIRDLRCAADEARGGPAPAEALAALASANRQYATSALLDEEMARYWSDQAEQIARQALDLDTGCRTAQRVLALALADRLAVDEAWQIVSDWPAELDHTTELARAEVAFRRRDHTTCRASRTRIAVSGVAVPEWLHTVAGAEVAE